MLQCKKYDNASAEVSAALHLRIPFFLNTRASGTRRFEAT